MTWPITYSDVQQARRRLETHLSPTPLRHYPLLDREIGHGIRVLVKHENHQPTGSFKVRNGLAAITGLDNAERAWGVVAATRGNHGLGLAHAGAKLGVPVTICVPLGNNPEKNAAIRGYGAELIEEGADYDESVQVMNRLVAERGLRAVHSTNEPLVIAGAATLTAEILEQARQMNETVDAMVVAVGGGSQAVGAMTVLRELQPGTAVHGVQAAAAPAIHDSWHAGRPLELESADTFAEGVATRMTYEVTFGALQKGLAGMIALSEAEIAGAVRLYLETTHNLAEGAGALGLAGLRELAPDLENRTVVVVLSGGNIDQQTLRRVISGEL
jgi:threonine dehydratase